MHIKSTSAENITVDEGVIFDYPMPNEELGVAREVLNGRCPTKGNYLNTKVNEIYFIIEGTATFILPEETYSVSKNDLVIIEPNTPYHIEDASNLEFIIISRPNWYEAQYKLIE